MNTLIIFSAKYLIIVPLIVALYYAWALTGASRKRYLLIAVVSLPVAYLVAKIGSHFYYDARPFVSDGVVPLFAHAADNGFPSDHTLLASALAAVVTVFDKKSGLVLWIVAFVIGFTRVLAGVHHPIDIIGSALIAAAVTFAATFVISKRVN